MNDKFIFLNYHLWLPILLVALALWFVFIWKEWSVGSKNRMWFKILVAFFTILALAMIALKPAISESLNKRVGVLLTKGSQRTRLDSLKKANSDLIEIHYEPGKFINKELDSVHTLFILGHGVPSFDFWQFAGKSVTYLGKEVATGITRLKYKNEQILGNKLQINGRYTSPTIGNRLVLEEPGGAAVDSLEFSDTIHDFSLQTELKVAGNYVYALSEKDSMGNLIHSESIPVTVLEESGLNILMINSFPTFETKYLKNYLAKKRHQVLVRSQLTQGKYKFEYLNRERKPLYRLNQKNLKPFDVLLIDAASYKNLSTTSFDALLQSVRNDGLGLFIQADFGFFGLSKSKSKFNFKRVTSQEVSTSQWPKAQLNGHPYRFEDGLLIEPIHSSNTGVVSAYQQYGSGGIGTTILKNTYEQVLNGRSDIYQELWSEIIDAIRKKANRSTEWESAIFPIYKNHPYLFKVRSTLENPRSLNDKGNNIPLQQDIDIPNKWSGSTYPRVTGWQQLSVEGDTINKHDFFVQDTSAWKALHLEQLHNQNKREFNGKITTSEAEKTFSPITPLWFFAVFILGMGWLWLEPKLLGGV